MNKKKTNNSALQVRDEALTPLKNRISAMQKSGDLHFPDNYSPQNALNSAWLILQETKDKDKNPALEVCKPASIYNALFDMVITGLNPAKKQGYFLVYGKQLVFQRSYFGSEALAKRVMPNIAKIVAEPVYNDDDFEFEIKDGEKVITKHKQTIESMNSKKVKAGYCIVILDNGEIFKTEIMTFEEIKKAWAMSKVKPITDKGDVKKGSTHDDFISEMVRKTLINRACKPIFNSSDDTYLKIAAARSEVVRAEDEAQQDIDENANQDIIDIDEETGEIVEAEFKEEDKTEQENDANQYLVCPTEINKKQPRRALDYCKSKCESNKQCNVFAEWSLDNEGGKVEVEPKDQAPANAENTEAGQVEMGF